MLGEMKKKSTIKQAQIIFGSPLKRRVYSEEKAPASPLYNTRNNFELKEKMIRTIKEKQLNEDKHMPISIINKKCVLEKRKKFIKMHNLTKAYQIKIEKDFFSRKIQQPCFIKPMKFTPRSSVDRKALLGVTYRQSPKMLNPQHMPSLKHFNFDRIQSPQVERKRTFEVEELSPWATDMIQKQF